MGCSKENIALVDASMPTSVAWLHDIVDGFKAFQVLRAGFQAGLFDWLEQHGPASKADIASALGLRGAHLGALLQTMEELGLLDSSEGGYSLAAGMSAVLCQSSPWCQAGVLEALLRPASGWHDMGRFLSETWQAAPAPAAPSLLLPPLFAEAQRLVVRYGQRQLERSSDAPMRTLLCFDGSDGLFAVMLCQRFPDLDVTIVVQPEAIASTEAAVATCGLADRCRVQAGTPLESPVDGQYDQIVLFHSLYAVRKSVAAALAAVAGRLAPGGELCSAHWFCQEACKAAPGGLRDLDKAVITDSHPLCGVERFCPRLEEAGLAQAEQADLAGAFGTTKLHFARRPASA